MKLAAVTKRLRTRKANRKRPLNNKLYRKNQKAFYSTIRTKGMGTNKIIEPPTEKDLNEFWGKLYQDKGGHREDAEWIQLEEEDMKNIEAAKWKTISQEELTKIIKRTANWKAPGIDQVQNFWLKHLTSLHERLAQALEKTINNPQHAPTWITQGRTTLIHKNRPTSDAKNYCPITCLPTYYKLATLILMERINEHVTTNQILPLEQKGARRQARGCKDHLLLDKTITEDAHRKQRNVSMMWIDYKKAYDSVPHTWIIKMMEIYKIDKTTRKFIQELMPTWRSQLNLHYEGGKITTDNIKFRRGIFQGDSLSPLLFCLCLTPITNILRRKEVGYKLGNRKVSNLLYIDDLKIYAKSDTQMERCKAVVVEFSKDIKMGFGINKCAVIHVKKGQIIDSPIIDKIPRMTTSDSYKYLGIAQANTILHEKPKTKQKKNSITE